MQKYTKQWFIREIENKLKLNFGRERSEASETHIFKACALIIREIMAGRRTSDPEKLREERQVHYLSMEFLMGRSLYKNAYNLGVLDSLKDALMEIGHEPSEVFEEESDAGLGNGGLGRLAACYLDAMTTLDIPATGYTICYELGIFRQKIVDGQQVELPDPWLDSGESWLITKMDETAEVRFGGNVDSGWGSDGKHYVNHTGYTSILAVPRDMLISGCKCDRVNKLRLWDAKSPDSLDMSLFSRGEYMKALEQRAMAEVVAKVLYPDDNHYEGKSLRLKQQYFFVSATVQSILKKHRAVWGTVSNFHKKHVIQINDTHPALVIPELMRILMDEDGLSWDAAWNIVSNCVAYTNHTVLPEALERWNQGLIQTLLPRIWTILCEINDRWCRYISRSYNGDYAKLERMAVIWDGEVRMANLCICACFKINGVSALHTGILKESLFRDACALTPGRFINVTNGIDFRRWLPQSNPDLSGLITELLGTEDYLLKPEKLSELEKYSGNTAVLKQLDEIKHKNKLRFADYLHKRSGIVLNTDAVFDVQVKRLHEYKRQLLNVIHICHLYNQLRDYPNRDFLPRTFIIGAKAAPGYHKAKQIIRLICSLSAQINNDPVCRDKLQLVFLENYRVSMAEMLMPAAEVSEQISTAGKEASGTGNMKFMLNGAVTIGTLDGANVEMYELLGGDNMFLFGLEAGDVETFRLRGYSPVSYYNESPELRRAVDHISLGFGDGVSYTDLTTGLLFGSGGIADEYILMADFESYKNAHKRLSKAYADRERWLDMSLKNIARGGIFSADRSVSEYADKIWNIEHR